MHEAITYIGAHAQPGDEVLGLGDWFHMDEVPFDPYIITHPLTQELLGLAGQITTKLIPGNHDDLLKWYRDYPSCGNPVSPIKLIRPEDLPQNGVRYCHGDEYDPACEHFRWFQKALSSLKYLTYVMRKKPPEYAHAQLSGGKTPGSLRGDSITERDLALINWVHSRALLELQKQGKTEGQNYKGIVLGHTHVPVLQENRQKLPFLVNGGDMRGSSSFVVEDGNGFHLMQWDQSQNQWQEWGTLKP